jgi:fatty-acyl-CoA synthase
MIVPLTPLEFERRAVALYGRKIGVVDGARRFTYAEFGERAGRLASVVRSLGVAPGERVAFLCYNCHQLLEAYYGVLLAGAILLPLNFRLGADELAYILDHAEARALFVDPDFVPLVATMLPRLAISPRLVLLSEGDGAPPAAGYAAYEELLAVASPERQPLDVDENAVAELFYTSGSTGRPKGVTMTHRQLYLHALNVMACQWGGVNDTDVLLHQVPLFHVNGWGTPHTVTAKGATHVMLRKFVPADVLRLIEEEGVTHLLGVPTLFNALLACPDLAIRNLSSLKLCVVGGAPSTPTLLRRMEEALGCTAFSGYGLTETTPVLTNAVPKGYLLPAEDTEQRYARAATTGLPHVGVEVRVVDLDMNDVAADGKAIGEIVVRSNVVMAGYFRDPEATAEAMRGGWFHTGDMAVHDAEGYITIVDRKKDIIISGGENISSVEVEKVIAFHPAVYECAVIAVPNEQWGEMPLAVVALREGASLTTDDLIAHCRHHLGGFQVPKAVVFRDALPKGGTGKILKNELREPYWAGQTKRVH